MTGKQEYKYLYIILPAVLAALFVSAGRFAVRVSSDVVINEVCTSNVTCVRDDNGNFPDWIELYNTTGETVDLSGYVIYKESNPQKGRFEIPEGIVIDPGAYYVCDPGFSMSSDGCIITLLDGKGQYKDRVAVPKLKYDTAYARVSDGDAEWETKEPTCGWANSDGESLWQLIDGEVYASAESGFYANDLDLKLRSSNRLRTIYYTTDGSDPVRNGTKYNGSIHISDRTDEANIYSAIPEISTEYINSETALPSFHVDKCTVVRAVAKDIKGGYTDVSTYTYFVGFDARYAYSDMAVVSLSADPEDLFDYEDGIMVLGENYDEYVAAGSPVEYDDDRANFLKRGRTTEIPAAVSVYDENHKKVLDTRAGVRVKGMSSRWDPQKSFNVIFHKAYGGNYKESFKAYDTGFTVHSLALDKCGQDTGTKMMDTIMEYCMYDNSCATARRIPCCVFLDGEYWGFYWIAERFDRAYLADRYGVDKNDIVIENTDEFDSYADWPPELFDRESLIEYYASNIITAHEGDWPHMNFRIWRTASDEGSKYGDGMYRPVILDMNSSSMKYADFNSYDYLMEEFSPFRHLTGDDDTFATELVAKVDSMCAEEFEKGRVLSLIDDIYGRIHDQMILDRMRYTDCSAADAEKSFDADVDALREFYMDRYEYLDMYGEDYLAGTGSGSE